jgi:hypothetical protein
MAMAEAIVWGLAGLAATLCLGNTVLVASVCCVASAAAGTAFGLPVPTLGGTMAALPWIVRTEYLLIVVATVLGYRRIRYGPSMRPKRERLARVRVMVWVVRHLPAPPPAIEAPAHAAPVIAGKIVPAESFAWTPRGS